MGTFRSLSFFLILNLPFAFRTSLKKCCFGAFYFPSLLPKEVKTISFIELSEFNGTFLLLIDSWILLHAMGKRRGEWNGFRWYNSYYSLIKLMIVILINENKRKTLKKNGQRKQIYYIHSFSPQENLLFGSNFSSCSCSLCICSLVKHVVSTDLSARQVEILMQSYMLFNWLLNCLHVLILHVI